MSPFEVPLTRAGRIERIPDAGGALERFCGKLGETLKEIPFLPVGVPGNHDADRTFTLGRWFWGVRILGHSRNA